MGDASAKIDVSKLVSYCDDLVGVLKNKKDINILMQSLEEAKFLQSSCEVDFSEVQNPLEVYQKKINDCQQRINEAKNGVVGDSDLDPLQKELEEELKREKSLGEELRVTSDKINDLECLRLSFEERKQTQKKVDKDELIGQRMLSMYASVTNIMPQLGNEAKVSGYIVEREKRMVEKFDFDPTMTPPLEICNSLWKMINV